MSKESSLNFRNNRNAILEIEPRSPEHRREQSAVVQDTHQFLANEERDTKINKLAISHYSSAMKYKYRDNMLFSRTTEEMCDKQLQIQDVEPINSIDQKGEDTDFSEEMDVASELDSSDRNNVA